MQKRVDGVQHGVSLHPRRSCLKSKVQTRGDISGREAYAKYKQFALWAPFQVTYGNIVTRLVLDSF